VAGRIRHVHTRAWGERGLGLVFGTGLLALLAGLVLLIVVLVTQGMQRAANWASVFSTSLAIAGALVTLLTWRSSVMQARVRPRWRCCSPLICWTVSCRASRCRYC